MDGPSARGWTLDSDSRGRDSTSRTEARARLPMFHDVNRPIQTCGECQERFGYEKTWQSSATINGYRFEVPPAIIRIGWGQQRPHPFWTVKGPPKDESIPH
jgi:hypothetical protein